MAEMPVLSELNAVVLKIEVAPGDRVEEGDTLIVLESMKTVAAILVQEKQIVEEGQKIAVLGA
jgi:acetyl-CoA carboxylase biotin carboxyl carrier protein